MAVSRRWIQAKLKFLEMYQVGWYENHRYFIADLARYTGVSRQAAWKWFKGLSNPRRQILPLIEAYLEQPHKNPKEKIENPLF
jgi:transcriptional regulator with XRE-family HTH domain